MYPDFTYTQAFNTVQSDPALLQLVSQKLDKLTSQLSREQKDCVIDMTNTSLSSRRKHMNKFNKAEFKATVFLPPMATIEARNLSRPGKLIPKTVYESMMKSFVMPIRDEGFTSIDYIL
jgi:predicted kinase